MGSTALLRNYRSKFDEYESAFAEASKRAQDASAPLFIPTFTGLRRTIVEHLTEDLQRLEQELSSDDVDLKSRRENVTDAVTLLRHMGKSSKLRPPLQYLIRGPRPCHRIRDPPLATRRPRLRRLTRSQRTTLRRRRQFSIRNPALAHGQ